MKKMYKRGFEVPPANNSFKKADIAAIGLPMRFFI